MKSMTSRPFLSVDGRQYACKIWRRRIARAHPRRSGREHPLRADKPPIPPVCGNMCVCSANPIPQFDRHHPSVPTFCPHETLAVETASQGCPQATASAVCSVIDGRMHGQQGLNPVPGASGAGPGPHAPGRLHDAPRTLQGHQMSSGEKESPGNRPGSDHSRDTQLNGNDQG